MPIDPRMVKWDEGDNQIDPRMVKWDDGPEDKSKPTVIGQQAFPDALRETLQSAGWLDRNMASAGTAASNLFEGGKQMIQGSELYNLIANQRMARPGDGTMMSQQSAANKIMEQEAPIGAFAGNVAATALPFGAIGKSVAGAGAVGAGFSAAQPAESEAARMRNTAIGTASGAGGQVLANKAGNMLQAKAADLAAQKTRNAPIDATIKEALDAGYVIPPGQVNPSFLNRRLESMGGKIATQQMASSRNQVTTDALARKAAGLAENEPITPDTLRAARDIIKKPYQEIAGIGLQPKLDALDAARAEANAAWREYSRQGTRAAINDYKQFSGDAKAIEKEIETALFKANKPELMKQFRDARVALAKNHDVESALLEGGGTIDAKAISRMFQRGDKMTGELKTIGSFANNFKRDVQTGAAAGTPDAHNLQHVMSLLMGGGGGAAFGPMGIALGALPVVSGPAARSMMFSGPVQRGLLRDYSVGTLPRITGGLLQYSPVGGTALGVPAFNE